MLDERLPPADRQDIATANAAAQRSRLFAGLERRSESARLQPGHKKQCGVNLQPPITNRESNRR
jgi:hypothetical protein